MAEEKTKSFGEEKVKDGTGEPHLESGEQDTITAQKRFSIKSLQGAFIIAKREFFANLKSVRMIVLMLLFILAVFGGAYGISGLSASTTTLPDVDVVAWAIVGDYDGYGEEDDILVLITDDDLNPHANARVEYIPFEEGLGVVLLDGYTDSNGLIVIQNISSTYELFTHKFRVTFNGKEYKNVKTSYAIESDLKPAYLMVQVLDLDDDNIEDDALILVTDGNFTPITDVNVAITATDYQNYGITDSKGIIKFYNLKSGGGDPFEGFTSKTYIAEVTYSGSTSINSFQIYRDDESVTSFFEFEGPDEVILVVALVFITMLGPIIAISLSFDSITKEKLQKSLDFLLSRPTGRRNIILGKFLGILTAIALPVTVINLLAIVLISSITNKSPTGSLVAGFIIYTIVFIAIYVLLQQIFSTLAKTTGTAILSGIGIWLIFNMFWSLISLAVGAVLGQQYGSDAWITTNNRMALMNPSGAYQLSLSLLLPLEGGGEPTILGVANWMPPVVMAMWLIIMFFLATEIFVRKANS